eukprot:7390314-Prymnesium_polylepis.1
MTSFKAGNPRSLALRAPRAISDPNNNKTLAGFHTAAQICNKTVKNFYGSWLSAVANFTTALESIECADMNRMVQAQRLGSTKLDINESRMAFLDVWDAGMIEVGKQESDRQLHRTIVSPTDAEHRDCEAAPPGGHQEPLQGGEWHFQRVWDAVEWGFRDGWQEYGSVGGELVAELLDTFTGAGLRIVTAVMLGKEKLVWEVMAAFGDVWMFVGEVQPGKK